MKHANPMLFATDKTARSDQAMTIVAMAALLAAPAGAIAAWAGGAVTTALVFTGITFAVYVCAVLTLLPTALRRP